MSIVGIVVSLCILGIGIWTAQNNKGSVSSVVDVQVEATPTSSPTDTPTVTVDPTNSPTMKMNTPTKSPTNSPVPTTNNSNGSSFSISGFHYPSATVISSSNTRLELSTTDSASSVTDWYKNKINGTGMNVKSFVTTTANEKVVNKLVAAKSGQEISVDITKDPGNTTVKVIVETK